MTLTTTVTAGTKEEGRKGGGREGGKRCNMYHAELPEYHYVQLLTGMTTSFSQMVRVNARARSVGMFDSESIF